MLGRRHHRPGREVLEGHGIILKSGMQVGLGKMSCVAGFGEETQIRELEFMNQMFTFSQALLINLYLIPRVDEENPPRNQNAGKKKCQKSRRLSNRHNLP